MLPAKRAPRSNIRRALCIWLRLLSVIWPTSACVLQMVDYIACEDTRHTQAMLRAYGIDKPHAQLLSVHQHNEAQASELIVSHLRQGLRLAFVSDAGTPGVSDPGARLVAAVRAEGLRTVPLPGACSVTTAISVAGLSEAAPGGFIFAGFLPSKSKERQHAVQTLGETSNSVVLLEAPHRIEALASALAVLGTRRITICRELTKQFEEIHTLECSALSDWLTANSQRIRGEFVLVLHGSPLPERAGEGRRVLQLLLEEMPLKSAARLAAEISGESRNDLYALGLSLK